MIDPMEVDIDYLDYIADFYKTPIGSGMTNFEKREFVRNIIHFLKRIGSYNSVYIIWKLLNPNTPNRLNVYERWHNYTLTGVPVESDWEDTLWQGYYSLSPSGGAGAGFYNLFAPSGYPAPSGFEKSVNNNKMLSPHYKIELDLSTAPLEPSTTESPSAYVISQPKIRSLKDSWNDIRPVSKFVHYGELLSPLTDFTTFNVSTYSDYQDMLFSRACQESTAASSGTTVFVQASHSATWTIDHTMATRQTVVQCYDLDQNRIIPDNIQETGTNRVVITFITPVAGYAYLASYDYLHDNTASPSASWQFSHGIGSREVLTAFDDTAFNKFIPYNVKLNADNVEMTVGPAGETIAGYGIVTDTDYLHTQTGAQENWVINHNLGVTGLMIDTFDSNWNKVMPATVTMASSNVTNVSFTAALSGYAVIKQIEAETSVVDLMNRVSLGSWKLGNGTNEGYNPIVSNDIQNSILTGNTLSVRQFAIGGDEFYSVDVLVENNVALNIREVGIFDSDGDIAFYSRFSPLYKPADTYFRYFLRISKNPI